MCRFCIQQQREEHRAQACKYIKSIDAQARTCPDMFAVDAIAVKGSVVGPRWPGQIYVVQYVPRPQRIALKHNHPPPRGEDVNEDSDALYCQFPVPLAVEAVSTRQFRNDVCVHLGAQLPYRLSALFVLHSEDGALVDTRPASGVAQPVQVVREVVPVAVREQDVPGRHFGQDVCKVARRRCGG